MGFIYLPHLRNTTLLPKDSLGQVIVSNGDILTTEYILDTTIRSKLRSK